MTQQVSTIMEKNVMTIRPESSVRQAADRMRSSDIGVLPVCDGDRVLGVITDRDIVVRVVAKGKNPETTTANEIMTRQIVYCFEHELIADVLDRMDSEKVGRIIVLTPERKLSGLISLGALAKCLGEEHLSGLMQKNLTSSRRRMPMGLGLGIGNRSGVGLGLGTIMGAVALIAGVRYLRNQPEVRDRLRNKIGLLRREAA